MADNEDGGHTLDDLARLQAEGVLEVHRPGTPEHAEARRAIREELAYADAEALALEGPDALTSDRLLRQAAVGAELDLELVGYAFAAWCKARGWERADLASWLGVTPDQLAAMALEPIAQQYGTWGLAVRYGADPTRLMGVLAG